MRVALGGTFDPIHDGHRELFNRAFELGDTVIGLTTDELAPKTRDEQRPIRPYEQRKTDLQNELSLLADQYDQNFEIRPLSSPTGVASERPELEYLVVSPETEPAAHEINELRKQNGYDPVNVEVVDHVTAEDGGIISSTRILRGEIDQHGNVVSKQGAQHADFQS